MDHSGDFCNALGVAFDFGLEALDENHAENGQTEEIAEDFLPVGSVGGGDFIGGKLLVCGFGIGKKGFCSTMSLNKPGPTNTFLKHPNIVILKLLKEVNNFPFNSANNPVECKVGDSDGRGHEEELFFGGAEEVDGGEEDDYVFVDVEEHVQHDEDLLVVLGWNKEVRG